MVAGHNGKGEGYAPVCLITQVQLAVALYTSSGQMFTCIHVFIFLPSCIVLLTIHSTISLIMVLCNPSFNIDLKLKGRWHSLNRGGPCPWWGVLKVQGLRKEKKKKGLKRWMFFHQSVLRKCQLFSVKIIKRPFRDRPLSRAKKPRWSSTKCCPPTGGRTVKGISMLPATWGK